MRHVIRNLALSALLCLAPASMAADAKDPAVEADAFQKLRQYKAGDAVQPLRALEMLAERATGNAARRLEVADRLAEILAEPKTSLDAKSFACRVLPLVASAKHVGVFVRLLADEKTAGPARRGLAAMDCPAAGKALREALTTVKGRALLGVIASLGDRRDAQAVGALARLAGATARGVSAAAVRALGEIGTADAAEALTRSNLPAGAETVLDARLRCAEYLAAAGNQAAAAGIYRPIAEAKGPVRWRVAGLSGLVATAGDESAGAVVAAMRSDEPRLARTALQLARRLSGPKVTASLVGQLGHLDAASQIALIGVLAERGDPAAAGAVAKRIADNDPLVRAAAVAAMARLGDASTAVVLARLAATDSGDVQRAARVSLARLAAPGTDRALLAAAAAGDVPVRVEAIAALGARRSAEAEGPLVKLAAGGDVAVRTAAVGALAVIARPGSYGRLVELLVAEPASPLARPLEKALLAVGSRLEPPSRVRPLLAAMKTAPAKAKPALLRLLAPCGGHDALSAVRAAMKTPDKLVADAAVRALADWGDADALPALLAVARDSDQAVHRTLALRGYLRLARSATGADRLKKLQAVRKIATTPAAQRLLLAGLAVVPDAGALDLIVSFLDEPAVRAEAALAALKVGKALLASDRPAVRTAMATLEKKAPDADVAKQARALHAESLKRPRRNVGGSTVGLQRDEKRSAAAKKALAGRAPKGYRLACYLDCGPDRSDGKKPAPTLRFLAGNTYSWAGADRVNVRHGTIFFASTEIAFEAAGLDPKRSYQVGLTWWDYDHNDRVQSVWASAGRPSRQVKLLGATKLPSHAVGGHKAAEKTLAIPRPLSVLGTVRVTFRNEDGANVVVSEIWLWESEATSPAPAPMAPGTAVAVTDRGARRPAGADRKTKPAPVSPGKKGAKRVLIVTGIDYPGHKWRKTCPVLAAGLDKDPRLAIDVVETPDFLASPKLGDYDVIVLHFMNWKTPDPGPAARENLRKLVAAGKGLVLVHFACGAFQGWDEFAALAGRAWNPKLRGHDPHGAFRVNIVDADHPITKGLKPFETTDEMYTCLDGEAKIHVLASSKSKVDKKDYPMAFVLTYGTGRVFHSPLGHDVRAFGPAVLALFRRGTAWAARLEPVPAK